MRPPLIKASFRAAAVISQTTAIKVEFTKTQWQAMTKRASAVRSHSVLTTYMYPHIARIANTRVAVTITAGV